MANERVTEDLVRDHFKRDPLFDVVKLEEQTTSNPKAKECLAKASKLGNERQGYPEFIISLPALPDHILVVECKADIAFHESPRKDQPVKFAVDGVLHYANFLSREFNVFAIAVSGADKDKVKGLVFLPREERCNKRRRPEALGHLFLRNQNQRGVNCQEY